MLPEEVKQKTNAVEILPAPQLTMGKATLSGKLLDYKHNYQLNLNAYLCELLTGNENEIPIETKKMAASAQQSTSLLRPALI